MSNQSVNPMIEAYTKGALAANNNGPVINPHKKGTASFWLWKAGFIEVLWMMFETEKSCTTKNCFWELPPKITEWHQEIV